VAHVRTHGMTTLRLGAVALTLLLAACGGTDAPTLTVDVIGSGSGSVVSTPTGIDCGPTCRATFASGRTVTLQAQAAGDSAFTGWTGCTAGPANTCTVTMTSSRTVTASFGEGGSISGTLLFPGDVAGPEPAGLPATIGVGAAPLDTSTDEAEIVPGQVIVRFAPGVVRAATTLRAAGVSLALERSAAGGALSVYRAPGATAEQTRDLVAELRARPDVADAFPNWILRAFKEPDDPFYAFQWHYSAINLPNAWDLEDGTTNDVVVAVLDSGTIAHPDLVPSLLPGYDFIDGDADPSDPGGAGAFHGTHVAGTVAAATDNALGVAGVSWGASVLPVRVLDGDGAGTTLGIIDGIAWAADVESLFGPSGAPANPNPARVINLSLGGTIAGGCPPTYDAFFAELVALDIVIVAAAGNANVNAATTFPAHCSHVVAVGATGPLDRRAPYSNFGSTIDLMAPGGDVSRTLTAGGQTFPAGVLSTTGAIENGSLFATYAFYQGTSMAAPHVAGVMALMLSAEPTLTPAALVSRLAATATALSADDCGRPSGADCGAGLIDAAAALAFGSGDPSPPLPPPPAEPTAVPTYVVAFYCLAVGGDPCRDLDLDRSGDAIVATTSNAVPYTVSGLVPGTYLAVAWQDLNQNVEVDDGEPIGIHPNLVTVGAGQARTGITIEMAPWEPLGASQVPSRGPTSERVAAALQRWVAGER